MKIGLSQMDGRKLNSDMESKVLIEQAVTQALLINRLLFLRNRFSY